MTIMAIRSVPPANAAHVEGELYAAYGLTLRGDGALPLPLPLLEAPSNEGAPCDVAVRRNDDRSGTPEPDGPVVLVRTCQIHGDVLRVSRGAGGVWFWLRSIGVYHLAPDLTTVEVYPEGHDDARAVGHALVQPVLVYILARRGVPTLHASAVETSQGVVAFLGASGQGKSTMTATFLRRGAALVTDDALPLRLVDGQVCGVPGPPHMKLWDATAEHALHLSGGLPEVTASVEKKYLAIEGRYDYVQSPAPLQAIYLLRRYDPIASQRADVSVQRLGSRDGLTALLCHTLLRSSLRPAEEAAFLSLYARTIQQAPVRVLTYPSGFEHQNAIHDTVLEDLGTP